MPKAARQCSHDQSLAPITSYAQGSGDGRLSNSAALLRGRCRAVIQAGRGQRPGRHQRANVRHVADRATGVANNAHNANSFEPYDPASILGDTSPTSPAPGAPADKGNNCGLFGALQGIGVK